MGNTPSNRHAGRDFLESHNETHLEYGTRRVIAKTAGFRLFDIHAEGSGTSSPPGTNQGYLGLGTVGDIVALIVIVGLTCWGLNKWRARRVRHQALKAYYREKGETAAAARVAEAYRGQQWAEPRRTRDSEALDASYVSLEAFYQGRGRGLRPQPKAEDTRAQVHRGRAPSIPEDALIATYRHEDQ